VPNRQPVLSRRPPAADNPGVRSIPGHCVGLAVRFARAAAALASSLALAAASLVLVAGAAPAGAQATSPGVPGAMIPVLAGPSIGQSFVPPSKPTGGVTAQTANIVVSYSGFTPAAQAAFQFAVDQWKQLISSPVTININANWSALGSNVLGQAGTKVFLTNRCAAMTANTLYAVALANALCGSDLRPGEEDGDATFNSAFSAWYFGTDGHPPSNQYDFVSVVMHELGHALGFLGSMQLSGSTGSWGLGGSSPAKYDRFAESPAGTPLLSYQNNSTALGNALQSNNVWFNGPQTVVAGGGVRARLYAPNPWQSGSSYAHLDDSTYPAGNPNSMMTPVLSGGEAVHTPGPVGLAIMYDQGWTSTPPTPPDAPTGVTASAGNQLAVVSWAAPASDGGAAITKYTVTSSPGNKTCVWSSGPLSCTVLGLNNGTPYTFSAVATNGVGDSAGSTPSGSSTPGAGAGTFTPLTPARILDTRSNIGLNGAFAPNQIRNLTVAGAGGVPASGVDAVALNVTATQATAAGYLTLFATGTSLPLSSNVNFGAGQNVPNLVVVKLGEGGANEGKVSIANTALPSGTQPAAGSVDVIADVVGYYGDATASVVSRFSGLTPNRILDTRSNVGLSGAFGPNQTRSITVTGAGVPTSADAVVMNVTVTQPSASGWLTLFPSDVSLPTASNLNFVANQTVPNLVVVKIAHGGSTDGKVSIANTALPTGSPPPAGTVHVVADVVGYYDAGATTGLVPVPSSRVLDTRTGSAVGPNATIAVDPRVGSPLPAVGSYTGVVATVIATSPTQSGWLTVFPSTASMPLASSLNFVSGQTVANLVMVNVGSDGKIKIANTALPSGTPPPSGTVHVIVDVIGFYR
jgi:hypothetical protein